MKPILRLVVIALLVTSFSCEKEEVVTQNDIESAALNASYERGVAGGGCEAYAGTIKPNLSNLCLDGDTFFAATPGGDAIVPAGFEVLYGLSVGPNKVIVHTSIEPAFEVDMAGSYFVHTLVYDPATLNPDNLQPGVTTIQDVMNLIMNSGICASLDPVGANTNVSACVLPCGAFAGTTSAPASACVGEMFSGTPNGDMIVPDGYSVIYGLTRGSTYIIMALSDSPSFSVDMAGTYRIHAFVYQTGTVQFANVTLGQTNRAQVMRYINNKGLCATFEAMGAPVVVEDCM